MNIKFYDIVKIIRTSCHTCLTFKYEIPCEIDKNIVDFMKSFGTPMYDINTVNLLKIKTEDNYIIEGRLKRTIIKFGIPNMLKNTNINSNYRKLEFEANLGSWLSDKFEIPIIMDEQGKI